MPISKSQQPKKIKGVKVPTPSEPPKKSQKPKKETTSSVASAE